MSETTTSIETLNDVRTPRWHDGAESRFMAASDGWVMVRRPGCVPYTMFKKDWLKLPDVNTGRIYSNEFKKAIFK